MPTKKSKPANNNHDVSRINDLVIVDTLYKLAMRTCDRAGMAGHRNETAQLRKLAYLDQKVWLLEISRSS